MTIGRVEWVLLVRFGLSAHRATYGRLAGTTYSKDFIQLSRKDEFVEALETILPDLAEGGEKAPLTYKWPGGSAAGTLVKKSSDRPHLSWVTSQGAPPPWRMIEAPSEVTVETIRGDRSFEDPASADFEFHKLASTGFGQPYLIAVKLEGEPATFHLRVHIENPLPEFDWADLLNAPMEIRELAAETTPNSVLAWKLFPSDHKLYFDTSKKADPWRSGTPSTSEQDPPANPPPANPSASPATELDSDATAESLEHSEEEVSALEQKAEQGDYEVPDSTATVKTRGSAQRVFAKRVKDNYGGRCALTGIETPAFLIASHIVPWSVDESIRLDPANGICLSVFVDRAFEHGYIVIQDDFTIVVAYDLIGDDEVLAALLAPFDGAKLDIPSANPPKAEYLKRRREL